MKNKIDILVFALLLLLYGCEKPWDDHYYSQPETVDENLWVAVQDENNLSLFVQYLKDINYDTLFLSDDSYTLFIPDNEAFTALLDTAGISSSMLEYHISTHYIQSMNLEARRKIQTLSEKFVFYEYFNGQALFDGIPLEFESPLYLNGRYFIMSQVALPRPNIYEYYAQQNPILKGYVDSKDSIILDKEKSRPIGFDSLGNTIYDTVAEIINIFEEEFFPISEEFRFKTATMVFPKEDDYNAALDIMAESIGGFFIDHTDIPKGWQHDILIPYLLERGVFENSLEESEFINRWPLLVDTFKLKNILGDSMPIDYQVTDKALCSNGYAYNYSDFQIPDTLFTGRIRFEAERLLKEIGTNKFVWEEDEGDLNYQIKTPPNLPFIPLQEYINTASNDTIIKINYSYAYDGAYYLEFNVDNLLPRTYLMVVRTHMEVGGIYNVYVNDELLATFDWYDYILRRGIIPSVGGRCNPITKSGRYVPEGSFNYFDLWVENLTDYGEAKIKFEYIGPGDLTSNGLVLDYIDFLICD